MSALAWVLAQDFFVLSLGAAIITTIVLWVKSKRFRLLYGLLIVTVLLFACPAFFLFTPVKPLGFGLLLKETDVADMAIHTLVTVPADTNQPVQVVVYLTFPLEPSPSSSGSTLQPTAQPAPVGTPGVPIVKAFGSGYAFFVTAQLNASAFNVVPQEQPERSLDQPGTFTWTLTPKYAGYQSIEVMVTGRWVSRNGGSVIERLLARQSFSFDVAATPISSFSSGLFVVLFVILSLLLNVPWIAELLKKRSIH